MNFPVLVQSAIKFFFKIHILKGNSVENENVKHPIFFIIFLSVLHNLQDSCMM